MGVLIAIAVIVAVTLVVGVIGDWFDAKTGGIVGAIVAGLVGAYLMAAWFQANEDMNQQRLDRYEQRLNQQP